MRLYISTLSCLDGNIENTGVLVVASEAMIKAHWANSIHKVTLYVSTSSCARTSENRRPIVVAGEEVEFKGSGSVAKVDLQSDVV